MADHSGDAPILLTGTLLTSPNVPDGRPLFRRDWTSIQPGVLVSGYMPHYPAGAQYYDPVTSSWQPLSALEIGSNP